MVMETDVAEGVVREPETRNRMNNAMTAAMSLETDAVAHVNSNVDGFALVTVLVLTGVFLHCAEIKSWLAQNNAMTAIHSMAMGARCCAASKMDSHAVITTYHYLPAEHTQTNAAQFVVTVVSLALRPMTTLVMTRIRMMVTDAPVPARSSVGTSVRAEIKIIQTPVRQDAVTDSLQEGRNVTTVTRTRAMVVMTVVWSKKTGFARI
jgi:hypothetical protein